MTPKRSSRIKRANGRYNVYLYYGWRIWFTHTVDTYEIAASITKQWRQGAS